MNISLAVTIPDEVKRTIAAAIARHEPVAERGRWVERDQLQFAIVTVGEVAPAFVPHITEAVAELCSGTQPFPVHACGFGFYGTKRFPHNVWAAVDPEPAMSALYESLWKVVSPFGFSKPREDFRPHIILGTFPGGVKNRRLIDALDADEEIEFGVWRATRLTIYDCRSDKRGKSYRKITQLPFECG